jgi:LysM repeat protein
VRKETRSININKKKESETGSFLYMVKTENLFPVALLYVFNKKSSDVVQYTVQNP